MDYANDHFLRFPVGDLLSDQRPDWRILLTRLQAAREARFALEVASASVRTGSFDPECARIVDEWDIPSHHIGSVNPFGLSDGRGRWDKTQGIAAASMAAGKGEE